MYFKLKFVLIIVSLYSNTTFAQYSTKESLFAKVCSKDECLSKSKNFVITEVLGDYSTTAKKVEMDALTASNSGELTTIYYKSEDKNKEGLVLCFFGSRWNDAGVSFQLFTN